MYALTLHMIILWWEFSNMFIMAFMEFVSVVVLGGGIYDMRASRSGNMLESIHELH